MKKKNTEKWTKIKKRKKKKINFELFLSDRRSWMHFFFAKRF